MISVTRLCRKIGDFKRFIMREIDDMLMIIGAVLISYGVYQIYVPAGYIVTGMCFILAAVIWSRGTGGGMDDTK